MARQGDYWLAIWGRLFIWNIRPRRGCLCLILRGRRKRTSYDTDTAGQRSQRAGESASPGRLRHTTVFPSQKRSGRMWVSQQALQQYSSVAAGMWHDGRGVSASFSGSYHTSGEKMEKRGEDA